MDRNQRPEGYDIIGDVHGMSDKLKELLARMGYSEVDGVWQHPTRIAVFVGDFVDKGPGQVASYRIVRPMVETGAALAVMGNHEFNAIAFHTPDQDGGHCRPRDEKNRGQHSAFLSEVAEDGEEHDEIVAWFLTLPLFIDDDIRVVHACWNEAVIDRLAPMLDPGNRLPRGMVERASTGDTNSFTAEGYRRDADPVFSAVETLLKGVEIDMPNGVVFQDKYGIPRHSTRVAWWAGEGATFRSASLVDEDVRDQLPDTPLPEGVAPGYDDDKPLFIGHYWRKGEPALLTPKVACVDYSACSGGEMVAYRWSGEAELTTDNFVRV